MVTVEIDSEARLPLIYESLGDLTCHQRPSL
jgi:hypothetical protein